MGLGTTDAELLANSSTDDRAFLELFHRHVRTVLRFTTSLLPDQANAEDIVQDAFFMLWKKRASVRLVDQSALPWLLTTCKHMARNHRRKADNRALITSENEQKSARKRQPENVSEELQWVLADIGSLAPGERDAITLCILHDIPHSAAASRLGISRNAVAKRIERARLRLRRSREERNNAQSHQ